MRRENDAYYSPAQLALAGCEWLKTEFAGPGTYTILEPNAGGGAFVKAARLVWPQARVAAEDIDPVARALLAIKYYHDDRVQVGRPNEFMGDAKYSLAVGNPPYDQAEEQVRAALARARCVMFLLRLSFLASVGRVALYTQHQLAGLIPVIGRPSYTDDGKTDNSEYGLFVWLQNFKGPGEVHTPGLQWRPSRDT